MHTWPCVQTYNTHTECVTEQYVAHKTQNIYYLVLYRKKFFWSLHYIQYTLKVLREVRKITACDKVWWGKIKNGTCSNNKMECIKWYRALYFFKAVFSNFIPDHYKNSVSSTSLVFYRWRTWNNGWVNAQKITEFIQEPELKWGILVLNPYVDCSVYVGNWKAERNKAGWTEKTYM